MPSLIETYSRCTGLKIHKMIYKQDFYPIPYDNFITLSANSGQIVKNYDHFQSVIDYLNPILGPLNIRIIQLGDKDSQLLSGTVDLRGKTTISQSIYILKNSLLHFGNDSWTAHISGDLKIPLVETFGTTDSYLHGPFWKDLNKTILLESHRWGRKPTFGAESNPKSVNLIPPEQVANSILELLNLPNRINEKTLFIGQLFPYTLFEIIPNSLTIPNVQMDIPFTVRMDLDFNEQNLLGLLQSGRKVTILTKKPINLQLLFTFKTNILSLNYELDDSCPKEYTSQVKTIINNSVFFTRSKDSEYVAKLRFHFFDYCVIEQISYPERKGFIIESASYLNNKEEELEKDLDILSKSDKLWFKSNKFILSNSKAYLSYSHLDINRDIANFDTRIAKVIDNEIFWRDINHYKIYENKEN